MSINDWIQMLVPVLSNSVIVFLLQKVFEKRQLVSIEKYKYVSLIQRKVDYTLDLFVKTLQTTDDDLTQISWLNRFISSYCDVYYYYQQNQTLFKHLENYMEELIKTHKEIQKDQLAIQNNKHTPEVVRHMESLFRKIYDLLQSIQRDCIQRKV
ncbi:MAG: hypothetical protein NC393_12090 [Clostridium sp.]|nr:hypothetical protein [Clostridium sp.]MCM1208417.1 hypothetical protein [Ruminococcus sp.]